MAARSDPDKASPLTPRHAKIIRSGQIFGPRLRRSIAKIFRCGTYLVNWVPGGILRSNLSPSETNQMTKFLVRQRCIFRTLGFVLVFALAIYQACSASASMKSRGGIFSLHSRKDQLDNTDELNLPYVAGLSVRVAWADIEKSPGQYDWSLIEKAHRIVDQKGKLLIVRIIAGSLSPQWIYAQGVPKITFLGQETNWMRADAIGMMPVPWNEAYLRAWERFVAALGNEISGWQNVYCVQMTGGGFIDEMHLPRKLPETIEQWDRAGISDEKLFAMWKRIIETYDKSIPAKIGLALDLGIPFARSRAPEMIYQYALEHYPGRVWFQQNGLKAQRDPGAKFPEMIRAASTRTVVGYQMLGGGKFLDTQTGDRRAAFENAINDNSSYVEVYKADLMDPTLRSDMVFLADALRR